MYAGDWIPGLVFTRDFTDEEMNEMVVEVLAKVASALGEVKREFQEDRGMVADEYFIIQNAISRGEDFTFLLKMSKEKFACEYPSSLFVEGTVLKAGPVASAAVTDEGDILAAGPTREAAALAFTLKMAEHSGIQVNDW